MHNSTRRIIEKIIREMREELERIEGARKVSVDDAIKAEGAMQSRYSTFKEEAQYLAAGHSRRGVELQQEITAMQTLLYDNPDTAKFCIAGSIVSLQNREEEERHYLLLISGGGRKIDHPKNEQYILVVNTRSLIGQVLLRKGLGDEVVLPNSQDVWEITSIV